METTTTTQSIELFITALLGQNYSPKTLRAYSDDLRQFIQWVGENRVDWDNPRRFIRADVEGFMSYLAGQHMTGVTRVRKLAAIRKLFTFMEENGVIAGNPANTIKGARREEKEPGILYREQYKALLYEASLKKLLKERVDWEQGGDSMLGPGVGATGAVAGGIGLHNAPCLCRRIVGQICACGSPDGRVGGPWP
jgi:site-specific recombinase XerD